MDILWRPRRIFRGDQGEPPQVQPGARGPADLGQRRVATGAGPSTAVGAVAAASDARRRPQVPRRYGRGPDAPGARTQALCRISRALSPRGASEDGSRRRRGLDGSRRRRGLDVDIPWRRVAATPRLRRVRLGRERRALQVRAHGADGPRGGLVEGAPPGCYACVSSRWLGRRRLLADIGLAQSRELPVSVKSNTGSDGQIFTGGRTGGRTATSAGACSGRGRGRRSSCACWAAASRPRARC